MTRNDRPEGLTARQWRALLAFLTEFSIAAAARAAQVGEKTLWRWLREPVFQEAYQQARREAVSQAIARLQQVSGKAVDALEAIIENSDAPAPARVSAAKTVLEMAVKAVELEDLTRRVELLEKALEQTHE